MSEAVPRVLVLDHRDSFVFTLVDHFARLGADVRTLRTSVSLPQLQSYMSDFDPALVLLSPGPGHPSSAGVMLPFLRTAPQVPIAGVCLGHQALALAAGGEVARATQPVHGRASEVEHDGDPIFAGIPRRFAAGRYHSLAVTNVPAEFEVIARAADDPRLVMAIRHRTLPQIGLQFHPESVLTPFGARLVQNLLHHATVSNQRC
jgi:anthranilate synthase/aminodeoxychorismate synthase-like glutamine amidotransferase